MGLMQWEKFAVQRLPIPKVAAAEQRPLVALVDRILAAKDVRLVWGRNPPDTSALEAEIDRLVYGLYGLTEAEIATVEGK